MSGLFSDFQIGSDNFWQDNNVLFNKKCYMFCQCIWGVNMEGVGGGSQFATHPPYPPLTPLPPLPPYLPLPPPIPPYPPYPPLNFGEEGGGGNMSSTPTPPPLILRIYLFFNYSHVLLYDYIYRLFISGRGEGWPLKIDLTI